MGKNNRQRRAAKARSRARSRAQHGDRVTPPGRGHPGWDAGHDHDRSRPLADDIPYELFDLATALMLTARDDELRSPGAIAFAERSRSEFDPVAEQCLLDLVDRLWRSGWQPAELVRQGRRGCATAAAGRLVSVAMATDHAGRRSATLDARWTAQVESLDLPAVDGRPGWFAAWGVAEGLERTAAISTLLDALANLSGLPPLDPILPPPGSARTGRPTDPTNLIGPSGGEADPILERIRALLAKAESSEFEAEASVFTAKAQELMTRHAIDAALLQGRSDHVGERPVMIRIPIDAPYVKSKALLLQTVAEHGRCRAVILGGLDLSAVVGFREDLAAVELLFTSLLLQAQSALAQAARLAPAGTRTRRQAYRSAFLLSYAGRIGDRLREINEAVYAEAEAEHGSAFLPVLRSRADDVDDAIRDRFGELSSTKVRGGYDAAGWASGRVAADNASLGAGDLTRQKAELTT